LNLLSYGAEQKNSSPKPLLSYISRGGILVNMEANPYAKFLNGRDPIEVIAATPTRLKDLIARMPSSQLALRPPQTPWNTREIVAHMADCDLVFGFRLRQTLAEDSPTVQPFDQDRWAAHYANVDMDSALRLFEAVRHASLLLIAGTTQAERERKMTHPERGTMTFWTVVETMAGHDTNHLIQLEKLAGMR
jgi:hypothetical protein